MWHEPDKGLTTNGLRLCFYIDNFSATFRICTPCASEAPPRMAQAT